MGNWKEDNLSAILEYPFDFERYIEERLREIDDLDERRFAKTVLLDGLGKIIKCTEQKYHQLEQRVYEEIEVANNQYETAMTIVKREHYDPTNTTLYPVYAKDLDEVELAEQLSNGQVIFLGSVFLETSQNFIRKKLGTGSFLGTLHLEGIEIKTEFRLCQSNRYREIMEQFYQVFQDNHIPWETVNTCYLDKFYDVFLEIGDEISSNLNPGDILLQDAQIRFGELDDFVRYGIIPLWNIEWITFGSADFMLPCINGMYYEHEFRLDDKEKEDGYLIQTNEDILEIRHENQRIVIKTEKEIFEAWKAIHIIQAEPMRSLDYDAPIITNHKNDSFFRRYSLKSHVQLMTKTDLFRRIMELDIRDFIEVTDYEIRESVKEYPVMEGMNWFVKDELFPMESRKVLLLRFEEKKPGHYLNDSMVQFVISQLQMEISEYCCMGVIQ